MSAGEVRLIDTPDFKGLVQLDSITPLDPKAETSKTARDAIAGQIQQDIAQDIYGLFTSAMTAQGGLKIDQAVITAVQAQMN